MDRIWRQQHRAGVALNKDGRCGTSRKCIIILANPAANRCMQPRARRGGGGGTLPQARSSLGVAVRCTGRLLLWMLTVALAALAIVTVVRVQPSSDGAVFSQHDPGAPSALRRTVEAAAGRPARPNATSSHATALATDGSGPTVPLPRSSGSGVPRSSSPPLCLYLLLASSSRFEGTVGSVAAHNSYMFIQQVERQRRRAQRSPSPTRDADVVFVGVVLTTPPPAPATTAPPPPTTASLPLAAQSAFSLGCNGSVPVGRCVVVSSPDLDVGSVVLAALQMLYPPRAASPDAADVGHVVNARAIAAAYAAVVVLTDEMRGPLVPLYAASLAGWRWWLPLTSRLQPGVPGGVHLVTTELSWVDGGPAIESGAFAVDTFFGLSVLLRLLTALSEERAAAAQQSPSLPFIPPSWRDTAPPLSLRTDVCTFVRHGPGAGRIAALSSSPFEGQYTPGGRRAAASSAGHRGGSDVNTAIVAWSRFVDWPPAAAPWAPTTTSPDQTAPQATGGVFSSPPRGRSLLTPSGYALLFVRSVWWVSGDGGGGGGGVNGGRIGGVGSGAGVGGGAGGDNVPVADATDATATTTVPYSQLAHESNVLLASRRWLATGHASMMGKCSRCPLPPDRTLTPRQWADALPEPYLKRGHDWLKHPLIVSLMHGAVTAHATSLPPDISASTALSLPPPELHTLLAGQGLLPPGVPHIGVDGWFTHPVASLPGTAPGEVASPRAAAVLGSVGRTAKRFLVLVSYAGGSAAAAENLLFFLTFGVAVGSGDVDYVVVVVDGVDGTGATVPAPMPEEVRVRLDALQRAGECLLDTECRRCASSGRGFPFLCPSSLLMLVPAGWSTCTAISESRLGVL